MLLIAYYTLSWYSCVKNVFRTKFHISYKIIMGLFGFKLGLYTDRYFCCNITKIIAQANP